MCVGEEIVFLRLSLFPSMDGDTSMFVFCCKQKIQIKRKKTRQNTIKRANILQIIKNI